MLFYLTTLNFTMFLMEETPVTNEQSGTQELIATDA